MCSNKIEKAIFWHFIFFITSFTYYGDADTMESGLTLVSYNYAKLKFIGSIGYSNIVAIILFALVLFRKHTNKSKTGPFFQFHKLIRYFLITGFGFGLIGFLFDHYYFEGLKTYGSYIIIIYIHTYILYKINSTILKKDLYEIALPLLVLISICTFLLNMINPEPLGGVSAGFYSFLLIPALLLNKKKLFILIGLFFAIYNSLFFSVSGKSIIMLFLFTIITFFLTFNKNLKASFFYRVIMFRVIVIICVILIPSIALIINENFSGSTLISSKLYQVRTLMEFIFSLEGLKNVATSPYIRITSFINILYEGIQNPIILLFGKGYGGYFNDHFNFFSGLNLSNGAFSDDAIKSGDYYSGHDSLVTIPMFNGLIGFFLLLKVFVKYIKLSSKNYFALSVIPFLLLAFYHDTLIGVTGVLLLFLSTNGDSEKKKNKL